MLCETLTELKLLSVNANLSSVDQQPSQDKPEKIASWEQLHDTVPEGFRQLRLSRRDDL